MAVGRPKADRQLAHCREEGLSCEACIRNSATNLARISSGLSSSLSRQLFFTMYAEPACQPMVGAFVRILHGESTRKQTVPEMPLTALQAVA
jgi:hypothetical protein